MKSDNVTPDDKAIVAVDPDDIPDEVPILQMDDQVAFPTLNMSLAVPVHSLPALETAMRADRLIGIVGLRNQQGENPQPVQAYKVGTVARILYLTRATDNDAVVVVYGLKRFTVEQWIPGKNHLRAKIKLSPEIMEDDIEARALYRNVRDLTQEVLLLSQNAPKEAVEGLARVKDPLRLAYIAAAHGEFDFEKRQAILEEDSLKAKLRNLSNMLSHEREVLSLGKKIKSDARDEMNKTQREYYLRQQLKAIKKELGELDDKESEQEDYRQRIEKSEMSAEARNEALRELDRFEEMSPQSAEYPMIKSFLDWLLALPWGQSSEESTDIKSARHILDEDHYGLKEIKERIVEYLAVRNILAIRGSGSDNKSENGSSAATGVILCFAGPPGVGKTSLGQSIARAMGREFTRMSLGGVRDEAEIRGHRRTYIGAMPGRIIQAIKRAGTRNPVFMLDEVDKIGNDWRGDPSSALLEVLDPAQNSAFRDHYLDVDFDLSDVVFIATANQLDTIPAPLRDRMEIIQLDGYTEFEKIQIAKRHLVPRQLENHGLDTSDVTFVDEAISKIIADYSREAGVRQLERLIGAICRKSIVSLTTGTWKHLMITPAQVMEYLKKEKFENELSEAIDLPGISTGLAVTSVGGDILFVEATRMNGGGGLTVTGQLGDVMKESAKIAYSFVRSKTDSLGIKDEEFNDTDVHLHVPAGAIPKDGPSAGIAMTLALASLFSHRIVRSDVGMTGEITLRGRVLPVGGIKMKVLAAHRAGLKTVILPKRNEKDLEDVPAEVRNSMTFVPVERIDEAIETALGPAQTSVDNSDTDLDHLMDTLESECVQITA